MRVTNEDGSASPVPPDYETLKNACLGTNVVDVDLVLDVYAVCAVKSANVDFKEIEDIIDRFDKADPDYWRSRMTVDSRIKYLEDLSNTNYMEALIDLDDPMKAALTFLDSLNQCAKAQAQKASTAAPKYDFEVKNGKANLDGASLKELEELEQAIAQDYSNVDSVNNMLNNMTTYEDIMEDEAASAYLEGGAGADNDRDNSTDCEDVQAAFGCMGGAFDQHYHPGRAIAKAVVEHGHKIPTNFPKFFDIFQAACEDVGSGKGKQVDADTQNVKDKKQMEELRELESVDPSELASDTFESRAATKDLEVARTVEDAEGRSHLFVLLDVSGSMSATAAGGVSRAFAANAVTLALLKYALDDKYKVWVVPFASNVDRRNVREASDKQSALDTMRWLGGLDYDGGGTCIESAILYAYQMLQTDPKYKKCEIVLISDGGSTISDKIVTQKPPNSTLRIVFLTNVENESDSKSLGYLKSTAKTAVTMRWDGANSRFDFGDVFQGLDVWDR